MSELTRRDALKVIGLMPAIAGWDLTAPQLESLALIVAGTVWLLFVRRRYGSIRRASPGGAAPAPAT